MDFHLTREQELVRQMMHDFTENEVKPIAAETDKTSTYPRENIEKLFDLGVMGMVVPEEFGGAGADDLSSAIAIEELSKQCASTGDILATHNGLCCGPIIANGTPAQKEKYLRMLTEGHKVGAFALTEPDAGSDAAKGTCVAELQGDHYVLNGSKIFITNGYVADVFVVFAMTDKSKGTRGISAFIVESSFPGFSVGKHEEKLGLHGSPTAEIVFTDCIVPKENLLGAEGKGFKIAMQTLDGGRIGIAAQALGIAEGAMEESINFAKTREQFGRPIAKFQNTQFLFADMHVAIEAARLLTYKAAVAKSEGGRFTVDAATAKLFASEAAMKITTTAGTIVAELFPEQAPAYVKQFTELAESGYYDDTYVFSVEKGVYFEAGSPNADGSLDSDTDGTYEKVERETSGDLWPFRGAFCVPTTSKEGNILDRFTGRMTSYCGTRFVVCNSIVFDDSTKEELQSVSENAEKINDAFLERGGVPNYSQQMTVFAQAYGDESFDTIDKITEAATQPAATEGGYTPPEDEIRIQTIEIGTYGEFADTAENTKK